MPGFPVQTTGTHNSRKDPALRLNLESEGANREIADPGRDNETRREILRLRAGSLQKTERKGTSQPSAQDDGPRWMGGVLPRNCAGHDISCPYGRKAKSPARRGAAALGAGNETRRGILRLRAGSLQKSERKGTSQPSAQDDGPRWMGGVLPRRFAGHD